MTKISSFVAGIAVLPLTCVAVWAQPKVDLQQVAAGMKSDQEALLRRCTDPGRGQRDVRDRLHTGFQGVKRKEQPWAVAS